MGGECAEWFPGEHASRNPALQYPTLKQGKDLRERPFESMPKVGSGWDVLQGAPLRTSWKLQHFNDLEATFEKWACKQTFWDYNAHQLSTWHPRIISGGFTDGDPGASI